MLATLCRAPTLQTCLYWHAPALVLSQAAALQGSRRPGAACVLGHPLLYSGSATPQSFATPHSHNGEVSALVD